MPLGKLYLEVSRNTYRIKGVLFWRANTQWCGLWKSKLAANSFITCLFAISYFLPIPLWFKSFLLGTFPPLSDCLQGQSLAVPFYCLQLNETANPESAFGARKIEQEMPLFLFLNSKSTDLGAQWSLLLPQEGCCPSHGTVPPCWTPWLGWVLCCSSESWLQKAFSRASQGCWRQQLDKARIQD